MSLPDSFAHVINLEFFDDLLSILQSLIQSGVSIAFDSAPEQLYSLRITFRQFHHRENWFTDWSQVNQWDLLLQDLSNRESLHCIQTVFTILSGQGVCVCSHACIRVCYQTHHVNGLYWCLCQVMPWTSTHRTSTVSCTGCCRGFMQVRNCNV